MKVAILFFSSPSFPYRCYYKKYIMSSYKVKVDHFRYILDKEEKVCWCYDVSDRRKIYGTLEIPDNIIYYDKSYKVIGIEDYGFSETKIKTLILPESLESIGLSCCTGSNYLEKVIIPASCKIISTFSFDKCIRLEEVIFKGNPNDIDIGMYAFRETEFVKKMKRKLDGCSARSEVGHEGGYIGKNLVTISCNTEELHIRPDTNRVYITQTERHLLELKHIYFPKGLRDVEFYILGIKNYNISAHFETLDDFLNCLFNDTTIFFSKLYINNKEINYLNLPKGINSVSLTTLTYFGQLRDLNLNLDLKHIFENNTHSTKGIKYIDQLYLPSCLERIGHNSFYSTNIINLSSKYSILSKFSFPLNYSETKIETLTIYIDEVKDRMFSDLSILLINCLNIQLIPIKKFSPTELYKILTELAMYTSKSSDVGIILDEDFLKIDIEDLNYFNTYKIFVHEAYFKDFKSHKYWSGCKKLTEIPDKNEYIINDANNTTCSICFNLNNREENKYIGIVKIPKKTKIGDEYYEVTGISPFAFTKCYYLEEVVISSDLEIDDFAFEDSYENIKITKL